MASLSDQLTDPAAHNAYDLLVNLFNSYGLGSLAKQIFDLVKSGTTDADQVQLALQGTDEWKKRFAGNEERRKRGVPVLSIPEYLATERSYRQSLQAYGLPSTFYDSPDDYASLIGRDVSAEEVRARAQHAFEFAQSTSPTNRQMLRDYYGIDDSHIAAYFLDPEKGQALLDKQAAAATYGGIAARQNLNVDRSTAENWYGQGISADQVGQGVQQAASILPDMEKLGTRYDDTYTQDDALAETVTGLASARRKRERLASRETATFGGATGSASFAGNDTGGF